MPRMWSASVSGTWFSTPEKTSATSPTGIACDLLGVDLSRCGVGDGVTEDGGRLACLVLGQHQRRGDLEDVPADVEDDRPQLPCTVDHLRGETRITVAGLRVDELEPDRETASAHISD